jgi:hypothetical protein
VPPLSDDENAGVPTREVDGERVLDEDVDDSLIDSAEADRAASTGDVDDD